MVVAIGLSCSMVCKIFLNQGWNSVPCIGKQILIHCATRETLFNFKKGCFFFLIFGHFALYVGSWFPNKGSNPHPLQWEHVSSTTGWPGNALGEGFPLEGEEVKSLKELDMTSPRIHSPRA